MDILYVAINIIKLIRFHHAIVPDPWQAIHISKTALTRYMDRVSEFLLKFYLFLSILVQKCFEILILSLEKKYIHDESFHSSPS